MANKTEVMNRAFVKMGTNRIATPDEDTEQARTARLVFPTLAQAELRRQVWSFAKKRATLAPLAVSPGGADFATGYNLPGDFLRLVTLNGNWNFTTIREAGFAGGDPEFAIEGRTLVTNDTGAAVISYIADLSEHVELWDATFVEAFACRLAAELTQTNTKNASLKQGLKQDYIEALKEAKRVNAVELPPQSIADSSWILARLW